MDRVSKTVRSKIMSSVRTRNTKPELILRYMIHRLGYRYSLHRKGLPGRPDLVFVSRRKIIFVHGCFWHGHRCRYGRLPKSRLEYWRPKIGKNRERDAYQLRLLQTMGWRTLVVWQCELKDEAKLIARLIGFLDHE